MSAENIVQLGLFDEIEVHGMTIGEAAVRANVSEATIRNWIKTGYLEKIDGGSIDATSFERFTRDIIGNEKLNSRANKSQKDQHNHEELSIEIFHKLGDVGYPAEKIGEEYEAALSDSYRNKEGIYYTPLHIVNDLLSADGDDLSTQKFCDPCCGSGNFVIRAIYLGFKPENVYGFDTDPVAVAITKKRIFDKTGYVSTNIFETDFLEHVSREANVRYDYIYTNPPWGKKLPKSEKENYGIAFKAGNSVDTSALLFFACLQCLSVKGRLGFLLPEAFFNISTFESARKTAIELRILRIIDYGKPFKGLLTRAQALLLVKQQSDVNNQQVTCEIDGKKHLRSITSFAENPKSILNFYCTSSEASVINHVFSIPHIRLERNAKWGLGIVTGNNKKFSKEKLIEAHMPVYKGSDIAPAGLKPPSCFIPRDLTLYQQVASVELYEASEKLIYKFISSQLCFYHDTEQKYFLNSVNMLIPNSNFPVSCGQLCDLLNCNFINWLFRKIFNTHKILRGDIESLPIHSEYFKHSRGFDEFSYLDFIGIERLKDGTYRIKR